jgi:hypothetical protein
MQPQLVKQISIFQKLKTERSVVTVLVKGNAPVFDTCICGLLAYGFLACSKKSRAFQKGATCPHVTVG